MTINFFKYRYIAFGLSTLLLLMSALLFVYKSLNLGIDFKGGIMIEAEFDKTPNISNLRQKIDNLNLGNSEIQEFGDPKIILFKLESNSKEGQENNSIIEQFKKSIGENVDYRRIEFVGPKVGSELKMIAIKAILFSLIAMFIYIWFRFSGWQFGLGALIALFHDVISTLGFFSISQIEFNLASIAAILTIAGYSINDTVVVFDRIRENNLKFSSSSLPQNINRSINESITRSLGTSITTLLVLLSMLLLGGSTLRDFLVVLILGVVVGTYSSIFVASQFLVFWDQGFKDKTIN